VTVTDEEASTKLEPVFSPLETNKVAAILATSLAHYAGLKPMTPLQHFDPHNVLHRVEVDAV
jgi:hypothetical protein